MNKLFIEDLKKEDLKDKKVLMRVDFNVPIENNKITSDKRIVESLKSINYVLENEGKLILFSHLGKVKTKEDAEKNNLNIVADKLSELLNKDVIFSPSTRGPELEEKINNLAAGQVLLVQNTRYEKGETKNDPELGKYWASLGDIFINDAFGTAHRSHASNVGIATHLKSVSGFLLNKEIKFLDKSVNNPKRPLVAILGGSKVSDKIGVIENLILKADKILIGGGMAYTFLKALGNEIGSSLVEEDKLDLAKDLFNKANGKIILPLDSMVNTSFSNEGDIKAVDNKNMKSDQMGLDIGPKTIELFKKEIENAKTIVWNGPMGVSEMSNFESGTREVCSAIASKDDAISIIGGGDSAAAAIKLGFEKDFDHISTGGGASLVYLEGKVLPGIESLTDK